MRKYTTLVTLSALTAGVLLTAQVAFGYMGIQPASAQIFDEGAEEFAPGQIIGPDAPGETDETAPGQIIGPDSPGETDEVSPGQEALDLGIIGPPKKIP